MFLDIHREFFEDFKKRASAKLCLFWPSREKTPPTEANIIITLAEVSIKYRYFAYGEVPVEIDSRDSDISVKSGPIDLILISEDKKEIIIFEAKTGQSNFAANMHEDVLKLRSLRRSAFFAFNADIMRKIKLAVGVNVVWVENEKEGKYFKRLVDNPNIEKPTPFEKDVVIAPIRRTFNVDGAALHLLYFARELAEF